jgi:hypothetical protein
MKPAKLLTGIIAHKVLHQNPIAGDRSFTCVLISPGHVTFKVLEQSEFQSATVLCERQKFLTSVSLARSRGDKAAIEKVFHNAPERLLRDAKYLEEIADRQIGVSADEVQCTMVRAPEVARGEFGVRLGKVRPVREE